MQESKTFVVTDKDLIVCQNYLQTTLQVLKDKGAPITGVLWLEFEKGWDFSYWRDEMEHTTHFKFWRKK